LARLRFALQAFDEDRYRELITGDPPDAAGVETLLRLVLR
jgi:hypothetical protein